LIGSPQFLLLGTEYAKPKKLPQDCKAAVNFTPADCAILIKASERLGLGNDRVIPVHAHVLSKVKFFRKQLDPRTKENESLGVWIDRNWADCFTVDMQKVDPILILNYIKSLYTKKVTITKGNVFDYLKIAAYFDDEFFKASIFVYSTYGITDHENVLRFMLLEGDSKGFYQRNEVRSL